MDLGLQDKVVIVGGASKGIGRAAALGFAREGAKVTIAARDPDQLNATAAEIRQDTGADILAVPSDLSQAEATDRVVDETLARFGTVHVLVANTGGPPWAALTTWMTRPGKQPLPSTFSAPCGSCDGCCRI